MIRKRTVIAGVATLFVYGLLATSGISAVSADDRCIAPADTAAVLRLKVLNAKAEKLKKNVEEQDKKRDLVHNGMTPETLEQLNDRQDSICLDLRSQHTHVELEIAEIKKGVFIQALSNQKK